MSKNQSAMKTKSSLLSVIFPAIYLMASFCACAPDCKTGSSSEVRPLADFNSLSVSSFVKVVLEQAGSPSVKVVTEGIDLDKVITEVNGNKLKISLQDLSKFKRCHCKVTAFVSYTSLKEIEASGSSEVKGTVIKSSVLEISASNSAEIVFRGLETDALTLSASNSSEVSVARVETDVLTLSASNSSEVSVARVETDVLTLSASNSAELSIKGKSEKTTIKASHSSEVEGLNLVSVYAKVSASNSSEVSLTAEKELEAEASNSATVRYKGNPGKIIANAHSGGSIKKL